jgi:hypothetical protein
MNERDDWLAVDTCIEEERPFPPEITARLREQPRLRRACQALERVDAMLRSEIAAARCSPAPSVSARVMSRIDRERPVVRGRRPMAWAATAAGLLAALWLALPTRVEPESGPTSVAESAASQTLRLDELLVWSAPLSPERALLDEGERLVADTRSTFDSLWSSLPLTALFARDSR